MDRLTFVTKIVQAVVWPVVVLVLLWSLRPHFKGLVGASRTVHFPRREGRVSALLRPYRIRPSSPNSSRHANG